MEEIKSVTEETTVIKRDYAKELLAIIKDQTLSAKDKKTAIEDYHDKDVAEVLELLTVEERKLLYSVLGTEKCADVFSYLEDADEYLEELSTQTLADLIENMDADDAVDILEELTEEKKEEVISLLDIETKLDIRMIDSYDDDLIGSKMTTNFITVYKTATIKTAMNEVIRQAQENDNINTIYVLSEDDTFYGAIELRDLVIARAETPLEDIIITSYPSFYAKEKIEDCIESLKSYSEDSLPVLSDDNRILGVITPDDVTEALTGEINEDYAKLAGLTQTEDINEPLFKSVKKRVPWLFILLFLNLFVSAISGLFEEVIDLLPFIAGFQTLILGMSGNVGTQSLAVTIRVLMAETTTFKEKLKFIFKEVKIGFTNGILLGLTSVLVLGVYMYLVKDFDLIKSFATSGCIGLSLVISMFMASLTGTVLPMIFKALKVDPAAASGPLITTLNDMIGVVTYYGLTWIILINLLAIV